jgi:hypothetical protein
MVWRYGPYRGMEGVLYLSSRPFCWSLEPLHQPFTDKTSFRCPHLARIWHSEISDTPQQGAIVATEKSWRPCQVKAVGLGETACVTQDRVWHVRHLIGNWILARAPKSSLPAMQCSPRRRECTSSNSQWVHLIGCPPQSCSTVYVPHNIILPEPRWSIT